MSEKSNEVINKLLPKGPILSQDKPELSEVEKKELTDKLGGLVKSMQEKIDKDKIEIPLVPKSVELDATDLILVENMLLKEESETYRRQLAENLIVSTREKMHDHLVNKYQIDIGKFTFKVENGKTLVITPK